MFVVAQIRSFRKMPPMGAEIEAKNDKMWIAATIKIILLTC
jgi:hypothetical protein